MARQLTAYVHVMDEDGVGHAYGPGDDIPAQHAALITNPDAWSGDAPTQDEDEDEPKRTRRRS